MTSSHIHPYSQIIPGKMLNYTSTYVARTSVANVQDDMKLRKIRTQLISTYDCKKFWRWTFSKMTQNYRHDLQNVVTLSKINLPFLRVYKIEYAVQSLQYTALQFLSFTDD